MLRLVTLGPRQLLTHLDATLVARGSLVLDTLFVCGFSDYGREPAYSIKYRSDAGRARQLRKSQVYARCAAPREGAAQGNTKSNSEAAPGALWL